MYLLFSYNHDSTIYAARNFAGQFDVLEHCLLVMDNDRANAYDMYDTKENEWYQFSDYHDEVRFKRLQDDIWVLIHSYIVFADRYRSSGDDNSFDLEEPSMFIPTSPSRGKTSFFNRLARIFFADF